MSLSNILCFVSFKSYMLQLQLIFYFFVLPLSVTIGSAPLPDPGPHPPFLVFHFFSGILLCGSDPGSLTFMVLEGDSK